MGFGILKTTKSDKIAGTTDKITFIIYHDKKEKSPSFMKKIKNFIGLTR